MLVGVTVLYNPDSDSVINNINTYIEQLDKLLLIDNSDSPNSSIVDYYSDNSKVHYQCLNDNYGIAFALNKGIHFAKDQEANWLLTMDQDSSFPQHEFKKFITFVNDHLDSYDDGVIFSPRHNVSYLEKEKGITKVNSVMTSGNLINMKLIDNVGYFDEKLFIDSVDHEFCFRIIKNGFSVYRVNEVELEHNLGELVVKNLFGKKMFVTNHNYIRRYYITRNLLYVAKSYSKRKLGFTRFLVDHLFWTSITILFYENDKKLKFKSMVMGLFDYKRGNFGKKVF